MTWLWALNFFVLQWIGVRLARVTYTRTTLRTGASRRVTVGWRLLLFVVPLTGWWTRYVGGRAWLTLWRRR